MFATKPKGLTGLDLEAGSIAAARVEVNGSTRLSGSAIQPLGPGIFREGEIVDVDSLAEALKELFGSSGLPKAVRVGVANPRIAVRTMRMPLIERGSELDTAVRFQASDYIPMPLDEAVLEYRVVNQLTTEDGERRMDVVVVAARRDMVSAVLEAVRKAGLRPLGIDLSAFGMLRAISGQSSEVSLYCNLGDVTNLAVARGSICEFTRISPFGIEGIAQRLAEKRALALEHARQWLVHVGLERPVEEIEGDPEIVSAARDALQEGTDKLADELRLSLEFYAAQEGAGAVEGVVVCGPGTTVPGLVDSLQQDLGLRFRVGRPEALSGLDDASAARLTLPYGLALEQ